MPSYIISCRDDATPEEIEETKQDAIDQGGKIGHEYKIIKGFSVTFDNDAIVTLESHPHVKAVEEDGIVSTQ